MSIGCKAVEKLPSVSKNAWMKYECGTQNESQDLWGLQTTEYSTVVEILNTLNANKFSGFDRVPARMLKDVAEEVAPSIVYLDNKSILEMEKFLFCDSLV